MALDYFVESRSRTHNGFADAHIHHSLHNSFTKSQAYVSRRWLSKSSTSSFLFSSMQAFLLVNLCVFNTLYVLFRRLWMICCFSQGFYSWIEIPLPQQLLYRKTFNHIAYSLEVQFIIITVGHGGVQVAMMLEK